MNMLEIDRAFYEEIGAPAIRAALPEYEGRIAVGLDADLVLFPEDPLDIMQDPEWVMIDGRIV